MLIDDFRAETRGPRLFHTWSKVQAFGSPLGDLQVALLVEPGGLAPDDAMLLAAAQLCEYVRLNGEFLADLLYSSYRAAEAKGQLLFWDVPADLGRDAVLRQLCVLRLQVSRGAGTRGSLETCVTARIDWDREHGLDFMFADGAIASANGDEKLLAALRSRVGTATERRLSPMIGMSA